MIRYIRYIACLLLALVLMAGQPQSLQAQGESAPVLLAQAKKKTTTASKPVAQAKKKTTPAKKATNQAKKTSSSKKPAAKSSNNKSNKKPATTREACERQQRELQHQIQENEKLIQENAKNVRSQNRDINIREDQIQQRIRLINSQQVELELMALEEDSLKNEIRQLQKEHEATKQKYAASVRQMYRRRGSMDGLLFIFSAKDLNEGYRRMKYLRTYGQWRHEQARRIEKQRDEMEEKRQELERTRKERESKLAALHEERTKLSQTQERQKRQLAELQKRNSELKGAVERDRQHLAELEQQIKRIIQEEIRREEEARRAAEARREARKKQQASSGKKTGSKTNGKTGGKTTNTDAKDEKVVATDHALSLIAGSFANNKGRMPYPIDQSFAFVSHYNYSIGNTCIVLSSRVGAHACAIFDGVVQSIVSSSEEWTVIVSHGRYRSIYSNLRNVTVQRGQKVTARQVLGTVKTEPDVNRSELRFWLWDGAKPINPERWLKR